MELLKNIFEKAAQFLRYLSEEYACPCFYVSEMREAQRKREQTCCEVREVIRRHQLW